MSRSARTVASIVASVILAAPTLAAGDGSALAEASNRPSAEARQENPAVASQAPAAPLSPAIEQLRHAAGLWNATTEFLAPDGAVARSVQGTYEFEWMVPDRVLRGRSETPELKQVSALLFYYEEIEDLIGMASVGADGHLWVMTGPADQEVRTTPPTVMPDGSTLALRFTRYNVEPDRFESKMEVSTDGGGTWSQGNHQVFTRKVEMPAAPGEPGPSPAG